MRTNRTFAAFNWFWAKTCGGKLEENRDVIWKRNQDWEYALTNDQRIWDNEKKIECVIEANILTKSDADAGFRAFLSLAEEGSIWAMCTTAFCYYDGKGVAADAERAEYWYRRSSEAGYTRATLDLRALLAGRGDREGAEAAFTRGVDEAWPPASFWLAWYRIKRSGTRRTLSEVRPLLERAAAHGSPVAQWILSRLMARGRFGAFEILRGLRASWAFSRRMLSETDDSQSGSERGSPVDRPTQLSA
jgi:TPR repeat protein